MYAAARETVKRGGRTQGARVRLGASSTAAGVPFSASGPLVGPTSSRGGCLGWRMGGGGRGAAEVSRRRAARHGGLGEAQRGTARHGIAGRGGAVTAGGGYGGGQRRADTVSGVPARTSVRPSGLPLRVRGPRHPSGGPGRPAGAGHGPGLGGRVGHRALRGLRPARPLAPAGAGLRMRGGLARPGCFGSFGRLGRPRWVGRLGRSRRVGRSRRRARGRRARGPRPGR